MELIKLDKNKLSEKDYLNLEQICYYVNNNPKEDIYTFSVNNDVKTVFVLKEWENEPTTRWVFFQTKPFEQGNKYAEVGFHLLLEELSKQEEINQVVVYSYNPIAHEFALNHSNVSEDSFHYTFHLDTNNTPVRTKKQG